MRVLDAKQRESACFGRKVGKKGAFGRKAGKKGLFWMQSREKSRISDADFEKKEAQIRSELRNKRGGRNKGRQVGEKRDLRYKSRLRKGEGDCMTKKVESGVDVDRLC